ncbi:isochorismatase family protein [Brachybacterium sp. ACRRE]|uniref:isochorismatase family protein n=1 Tax=Brachybacterium sp. ACRRE TaxID=2918184 RepID=UPI001EF36390|nr:isochorismatase family protein [Brachybacterium sp. ACRRE]MCG7311430.1 isochorismatase family protein [Brachybacterium sp. ACRRE]
MTSETETETETENGRRALLVVDLQAGVVDGAYRRDAVLCTAADLVERARGAAAPVIWIQHADSELVRGSPAWQIVDELDPQPGEVRVEKAYGDAFAETALGTVLDDLGVTEVVLVGAASEQCIRSTMHGAVIRGYDVVLVKGGHTTTDLTDFGLPDPATVVSFMDAVAGFGMQWPDASARSVPASAVGF